MMQIAYPKSMADFPTDHWHMRRYRLSAEFLTMNVPQRSKILDLGTDNGLSQYLQSRGWDVTNTMGEDLDLYPDFIIPLDHYDCVTAFEILEHLVSPFELLRMLPSDHLVLSVPLRLWFARAYNAGEMDRHYHEFEPWQLDWLLSKAGWRILSRETHTSPTYRLGLRSILRWVTPRWYFVYAERR